MNNLNILKKTIKAIYFSFKFYFSLSKDESLLASLPRSGTHLTIGLINICYSMKLGFPGKLGVVDNAYSTFSNLDLPFDERSIFHSYSFQHFPLLKPYLLWHSHLPYTKIVPLRKKFCKTVVLIREPVEGIKSFLLHVLNEVNLKNKEKYFNKPITSKAFYELDKKYKFVLHYSNFLDSWKKRKIEAKKNQIIIFDNKFIIKNTHKYLKFLNKFFEFGFSKRQMQVAVEQLDIKRISKMTSSKSIRITKKKISFSKDIEEFIVKNCKEKYLDILNLADNNKIKN